MFPARALETAREARALPSKLCEDSIGFLQFPLNRYRARCPGLNRCAGIEPSHQPARLVGIVASSPLLRFSGEHFFLPVNDIRERAEGIIYHSGIGENFSHVRLQNHTFAPARAPRTDDTDIVASFRMHHNKQFVQMGTPQNDKTVFRLRVRRVENRHGKRIAKHRRNFFETPFEIFRP